MFPGDWLRPRYLLPLATASALAQVEIELSDGAVDGLEQTGRGVPAGTIPRPRTGANRPPVVDAARSGVSLSPLSRLI